MSLMFWNLCFGNGVSAFCGGALFFRFRLKDSMPIGFIKCLRFHPGDDLWICFFDLPQGLYGLPE